jgi:hypothetical protein
MKKLFYLLTLSLIFVAISLTGCKKECDKPDKKPPKDSIDTTHVVIPVPVVHTYSHNVGNDSLNLLLYRFSTGNLKDAIVINDTMQYIKITSFYSKDAGQRNIHEFEVFSDSNNVALNKPLYDYEQSITDYDIHTYANLPIDDFLSTYYGSPADTCTIITVPSEANHKEYMNDGNLITRWSSVRLHPELENDTIGLDTVVVVLNLKKIYIVDSIRLHLGCWTQVFDVQISKDNTTWKYINADEIKAEAK